ncbi:MAG TPA: DUF2336 domain-containing protein [Acetobacteraceae bacterium]|nr:DUF2336 domain-containing protein [Acetobacteraceae bacterium]
MSAALSAPAPLAALGEGARVRLGAAADTAPEVLQALAADPSLTVRAAVAMNAAAPAQAHRLLAADPDERVRTLLARTLARLIPDMPRHGHSAMAEHVLATLAALVADEAERVRCAIAEVVREMPQAPRELILRLARDTAVPVSEPVIRLSPLLGPDDLLALLAEPPSPGTAMAIARRPGLHASVADAIAASADSAAIAALLANTSAAIREATLDALIARAAGHVAWHAPLVRRPALSARAARALSEIVATQLLGVLASRGDLDPSLTRELQRRLQERVQPPPPAAAEETLERLVDQAQGLRAAGRLDEAALLEAAEQADARRCTALLAVAADVPVATVERTAALRSAKGLVSLIWKAGFSMRCAVAVQALLGRLDPTHILRGGTDGGFPLSTEEMRWQVDFVLHVGG